MKKRNHSKCTLGYSLPRAEDDIEIAAIELLNKIPVDLDGVLYIGIADNTLLISVGPIKSAYSWCWANLDMKSLRYKNHKILLQRYPEWPTMQLGGNDK